MSKLGLNQLMYMSRGDVLANWHSKVPL